MSYICIINFPNDPIDCTLECMKSLLPVQPDGFILARQPTPELLPYLHDFLLLEPYVETSETVRFDIHEFFKYVLKQCLEYNEAVNRYCTSNDMPMIRDLQNIVTSYIQPIQQVVFVNSYYLLGHNYGYTFKNVKGDLKQDTDNTIYLKQGEIYLKTHFDLRLYSTPNAIDASVDYVKFRTSKARPTSGVVWKMQYHPQWTEDNKERMKRRLEQRRNTLTLQTIRRKAILSC